MAWSRVNTKFRKPILWWIHKILCEFGWSFRQYNFFCKMYYYHLDIMCKKYKINLYGQLL